MTKQDRENWKKRKEFEDESIEVKPWRGLRAEHQNTRKHEFVKFCLTRAIRERADEKNEERDWDSEVTFPNGRECDVIDIGPPDGQPVVYEVETDVTEKRKREKLDHFLVGPVREVMVIDPADVPNDMDNAIDYLLKHWVI